MSYSFGMFFKEIKQEEIILFIDRVKKELFNNAQEYLKNSIYYIPSLRHKVANDLTDKYWLSTLFELSFVYWPEKNIFGLCGYNYPDAIQKMFDGHFCFQNSTDRDYAYNEWPTNISLFQKHVSESQILLDREALIMKYMNVNKCDKKEAMECFDTDMDYYRKTLVYDSIWQELALDDWLYGRENFRFIRLSIQTLDCEEKKFKAEMKLMDIKAHVRKSLNHHNTEICAEIDEPER